LAEPLRELASRHLDLSLVVVADRPPDLPGLRVEFRRWTLDSEVDCFRDFRVGLMPLRDTKWARSKCSLKAIQYMALGIPAVVSPVGMNNEVVRDGENGFLAESPADWVRILDRLLSDKGLAARIGEAGRETVVRHYSVDVLSKKLISTLEALTPRERQVG
jgi:glycosyltransferase involved in cell wall biosynthesis